MEQLIRDMIIDNAGNVSTLVLGILWIRYQFNSLEKKIDDLNENKTWSETCDTRHIEINRRLNRLESIRNGKTP